MPSPLQRTQQQPRTEPLVFELQFWLYETPGVKRTLYAPGGIAAFPVKAPAFAPVCPLPEHEAHGRNSQTRYRRDYSTVATRLRFLGGVALV